MRCAVGGRKFWVDISYEKRPGLEKNFRIFKDFSDFFSDFFYVVFPW